MNSLGQISDTEMENCHVAKPSALIIGRRPSTRMRLRSRTIKGPHRRRWNLMRRSCPWGRVHLLEMRTSEIDNSLAVELELRRSPPASVPRICGSTDMVLTDFARRSWA